VRCECPLRTGFFFRDVVERFRDFQNVYPARYVWIFFPEDWWLVSRTSDWILFSDLFSLPEVSCLAITSDELICLWSYRDA
jgi:hypothetical protein